MTQREIQVLVDYTKLSAYGFARGEFRPLCDSTTWIR